MKKWVVSPLNKENAKRISEQFSIHILPAMLIDIMGMKDDSEIEEFLSDDVDFTDPYLVMDMDKAVDRITRAINENERICVYGDYDADGVTSTALLYSYLLSVGADAMYYIPARETEGYGLNNKAIDTLKENYVNLIITVDNGVSAYEQVEYANSLGIDTVVTDHHAPPAQLPNAVAVVNPHREDDQSPFKQFSGVGIAFKLVMALEDDELDIDSLLDRFSDIAAMGTMGDVVSLTGENRYLVKEGLKRINSNARLGIHELRKDAGTDKKIQTAGGVAFTLIPRINAGGRLGLSQKSVDLLLSENNEEASAIAQELGEDNRNRQALEHEILKSVEKTLQEDHLIRYRKVIVVAGEGWHQGVIGIVAARIKDRYGKPTVIISYDGENAKGSGRSVEGFALCDAVSYCKELLTIFGGHPMAAGMSLPTSNIDAFREKLNEYADSLKNTFYPILDISCKLNPAAISVDMAESLSQLEPYGSGNPTPVFGIYNMTLTNIVPLSGGKHLRLVFRRNRSEISGLLFGVSPDDFPYEKDDILNIAATLDTNEYNSVKSVSIIIKELSFANSDNEELMKSNVLFEELMIGKPLTDEMKIQLKVTRDDFVIVYRYLRSVGEFKFTADILHNRINNRNITLGKLMLIIESMSELGLITTHPTSQGLNISVVQNPPKVNILSAPILMRNQELRG